MVEHFHIVETAMAKVASFLRNDSAILNDTSPCYNAIIFLHYSDCCLVKVVYILWFNFKTVFNFSTLFLLRVSALAKRIVSGVRIVPMPLNSKRIAVFTCHVCYVPLWRAVCF